ncbi:MAG: ATP-dependent DNA helicase [Caldilineae bacterium]|nr:ATP-dependent DNA helicase [Caldilineae bacterium]
MPAPSPARPEPGLDAIDLSDYLGPGGRAAEVIRGYESRPSQLAMAEAVRTAILSRNNGLIEAPTGTGKSLAYLVPALLSGRKVIIATANKSLQQQLHAKDVPLASRIVGRSVSSVLVKGRSNYVCPWKWDKERVERQLLSVLDGEDQQVEQLKGWLAETETGDVDELPFLMAPDLRPRVVSFTDDCIQGACPYWDDACFVNQMRDAAAMADVVITNHHLLLTALQLGEAGERILPPAAIYVIDEAHHLVDTATAVFEVEVSDHAVEALLQRGTYREHVDADALDELRFEARLAFDELRRLRDDAGPETGAWRIEVDLPRMRELARRLKRLAQRMQDQHPYKAASKLAAVGGEPDPDWPFEAGGAGPDAEATEARSGADGAGPEAPPGSEPGATPAGGGAALGIGRLSELGDDGSRARVYDLAISNLSSLADKLAAVASSRRDAQVVRYAEPVFGRRNLRLMVHAAPITPALGLAQHLFGVERRTVVCTSATLAAGRGFAHFRERCGLTRVGPELVTPPVFDYPSQALLYQPQLSAYSWANRDRYYADVADEIARLLELSRGRALCLFTSWTGLQQTRALLDPAFELEDAAAAQVWGRCPWPLRAQGDAPREALLDWFRDTPHSVLLATRSFWEGVDIPGEDLSLVVLDKLPFPSPGDPLHEARMRAIEQAEGSSFGDYMLPLMTLTLKQGFGRLIRRAADRGVVAILDERLTSKGYGRQVRRDLPPAGFSRSFADVAQFYRAALDSAADFALNVRARRLSAEAMAGRDVHLLSGEDAPEAAVAWWWQLTRLVDGRSDAHEGIEPSLPEEISGAFHAAVLGLTDLRRRVETAGRSPAEFAVELRAEAKAAGWLQDAAELPADATGGPETARPQRLVDAMACWKAVRILPV